MPPTSPGMRSAYYWLLDGYSALVRVMDEELQRDCGVPLFWYDVMVKLWLAPGHELRMSELAEQVLLSRSWLTRRVVQLEDAGLVVRRPDDGDRRGVVACMTELGAERFHEWERSHTRTVKRHFGALFTAAEVGVLEHCGRELSRHNRAALRGRNN